MVSIRMKDKQFISYELLEQQKQINLVDRKKLREDLPHYVWLYYFNYKWWTLEEIENSNDFFIL